MFGKKHMKVVLFTLILFAVGYSDPSPQQQECEKQLMNVLTNQKDPKSQVIIQSSSQGINNLGDMDRCLNYTDTNFMSFYLNITMGNINPTPYVLCLPGECTQEVVEQSISTFNNYLNQIMALYPNFQPVEITSVYDGTNNGPSINGGAITLIIFFAIIVLASISGSIIVYNYEDKKEQVIKKRIQQQQEQNAPRNDANAQNESNEQLDQPEFPQESTFVKVGRAFGLVENFTKLFSFKSPGHIDFSIYNGTRYFLICWIILGQSYLIRFGAIKNVADRHTIETTVGYSTIAATSQLAVDMFFFVSGFLLAAITLERFINRTELKITDLLVFIAHRFIRLWPTYFIVLVFYWQIWQFSGDGPMWNQFTDKIDVCNSRSWANILMIDNLANNGDTQGCFQWGFVIANEIQFFIIGTILLYIYHINSKVGLSLIFTFFVASQVSSIIIATNNDYTADYFTFNNPSSFYNNFYIKPWVKMGTYILGMMSAIFYRSFKTGNSSTIRFANKVLKTPMLRYVLYFIGLSLMSAMVWCVIPVQKDTTNWTQGGHSTYLAFGKIGFVLGYFLITFPLMFGHRNIVRGIFGSRFWIPLSRVSFCMYLVHQFMIERSFFNQRSLRYFDNQFAFYSAISDVVFSIIMGAAFCVFIEIPIQNLEKLFIISPQKLKGIATEENDDFEAVEIKKQLMSN